MIYFIKPINADGPIKIGYTGGNLKQRFSSIQCHSPVKLEIAASVEGDFKVETRLHYAFRQCHLHGEWFTPNDEMKQLITYLNEGNSNLGIYGNLEKDASIVDVLEQQRNDILILKWRSSGQFIRLRNNA